MRKKLMPIALALVALMLGSSLAWAEPIKQFAFGVRVKSWELLGDKKFDGTVIGDQVDEKDELYPTNANMLFLFCPYGGIGVEWDRFNATMGQDGSLTWDTFTLGLNARVPLEKYQLAPYAVLGITYNLPRFDEANWWRYGWNSLAEYDTAQRARPIGGDPDAYNATGRTRNMSVDNSVGWVYGVGVDIMLTKNLALNLDARWNRAVSDAQYTIVSDDGKSTLQHRDFDYSLDTVSYGIGFRWYF